MFQAKGCTVFGSTDKNVAPLLEKLDKEKTLVYNLTKDGVSGGVLTQVDLSLDKFSEGVDQIISTLVKADDHALSLFVADTQAEAISGMVVAAAVRSVQTIVKMRAMVDEGITEKDWTLALVKKTFETPVNDNIDCYDVINNIVSKLPSGALGKILTDLLVDLCGDKAVNIRDNIKVLKEKFDKSGESFDAKIETVQMLERYFNAVCVCSYIRAEGEGGYKKSFSDWCKDLESVQSSKENGIRFWKDMTFFSLAPVAAAATAAPASEAPAANAPVTAAA